MLDGAQIIRGLMQGGIAGAVLAAVFFVFLPHLLKVQREQFLDLMKALEEERHEQHKAIDNLATLTAEQTHEIRELRRDLRDSLTPDIQTRIGETVDLGGKIK